MRKIFGAAAAAALVSAPVHAAEFQGGSSEVRAGAFLGARLRLPLDGGARARPQAALTLAPATSYRSAAGRTVTRLGEGVALDFAGRKPALTLGGVPADVALGLRRQGQVDAKHKLGISTGGWIVIGVIVAAGAVYAVTQLTCIGEDPDYCGSD